jgi:hypothetical protein
MSQLVFPSALPGLKINVQREPWYDVKKQVTLAGKELRSTWQTWPRTRYKLAFEILRSDSALTTRSREWQQLFGHLARHFGEWDSFLLADPEDQSVVDHGFAVGDGTTAAFQLGRTLAGAIIDASGAQYNPQTKPYTNLLKNSSFEFSSGGLATNWNVHNNSVALEPHVALIVPGMNGGVAQRISWGTNSTQTKGVYQAWPAPSAGQWRTVSFYARATGSNVGQTMSLQWSNPPSSTVTIANPPLSATWQRYVFQVLWNVGATVDPNIVISLQPASGTFGDLDFDLAQVVAGQHGVNDFQPIETPAAATGTRTPSYWPSALDGYEPIYDLNGNPTLYQDGDWQGRRTLYAYARTNLLPWSSAFDNAAWAKTNAAITAAATTAPDGTLTGETFNEGTVATTSHYINENTSPAEVQGELRCYSVFLKANTLPNVLLRSIGNNEQVGFNLGTGVIDNFTGVLASGVITSPLWPGWYRVWFVKRVAVTLGTSFGILGADATYTQGYTGTSRTFSLWGAMCERVSNLAGPTPYIPTPGAAAVTVTDYSLSASGAVTPAAILGAGVFLSWDGSFYRRVRFDTDRMPADRIAQYMWECKQAALITVKP